MKLRTKMIGLFFISAVVSVMVFLLSTYYILNYGFYSGISQSNMKEATVLALKNFSFLNVQSSNQDNTILCQLQKLNSSEGKMKFAVWSDEHWISDQKLPEIQSEQELLEAIQGGFGEYQLYAGKLEGISGYLICYVRMQDFQAMSYTFNPYRAEGILGRLGLIGLFIAMLITGLVLYLFSQKQIQRFDKMQNMLQKFALEQSDQRMQVKGSDELSIMAANFNAMADKIQAQYAEKVQYDKNRQTLVTNLSHDLRTPLSSVIGYSEMLRDEIYENKEQEKQYIDIIHRKAQYMEYLLNELLEYSRLESGSLKLDRARMNLTELIREIMIEYYPVIEKNHYELILDLPEADIYGYLDKNRMSRVLRNLVDNALKYGMGGGKLRIALSYENQKTGIEIQDYGIGLKKEDIEHVFDMFYRADGARNSKSGGMGLGMYIAREIVSLHGGEIEVQSEYQQGTIVRILM